MRIFQPSLFVLGHFLCVSLPATAASLDSSSSIAKGPQENYGVAEGAKDKSKAGIWELFPSPSDVFESVQNAYLPSTVRMAAGIIQAGVAPKPSSEEFWENVQEYEHVLQEYVPRLLGSAADYFKSTAFTDITSTMNHIVNATATFRDGIQGRLDTHNVTLNMLTEELEVVFMGIVRDLEQIPPPVKTFSHAEREETVDKILMDTTLALANLGARYGIEEEVIETYLSTLAQHVRALVVAVGDINEQYPDLLPALAFAVVGLLIPESWILRPLLSLFGFGPSGPIKGTAAAWLQRLFWGAAVSAGSWFSWLQAAGMGKIPTWAWIVTKVPWLIGALLALLLPCLRRG